MDYENNREFIKDYVTSVIEDLGPMIFIFLNDSKYSSLEIEKIFFEHVNITELNRFCDIYNDLNSKLDDNNSIFNLGNNKIYMSVSEIIYNYKGIMNELYTYEDYLKAYDRLYMKFLNNKKKYRNDLK